MLPWPDMLRAALAAGLGPSEFWALSLREWLWLTRTQGSAFNPNDLKALMREHPDG